MTQTPEEPQDPTRSEETSPLPPYGAPSGPPPTQPLPPTPPPSQPYGTPPPGAPWGPPPGGQYGPPPGQQPGQPGQRPGQQPGQQYGPPPGQYGQPAYAAGAYGRPYDPAAPYGYDPRTGLPYSDKTKIIAGLLQILIPLGIGRFYTGHTNQGVAQLLVTIFTCGIGALWPFVDGILILVGDPTDAQGRPLRP